MPGKKEATELFNYVVDIVRAIRTNRKIEVFRGGMEKMGIPQISVLYQLYDKKTGASMGELAKTDNVKMPTMTDIVAALVKDKYAARLTAAGDRRKVIAVITEKGRKLVEYNRNASIDYIEKYMSELNHLERKVAMLVVRRTKDIFVKRFEK